MTINYHKKKFKSSQNSAEGEVSGETVFSYFQKEKIVWGTYEGGAIIFGTITGKLLPGGKLEFAYQHVNDQHDIRTGRCKSTPEILKNGLIRLHEKWQWTSGDLTSGESVIDEVA